jgi:RNA polymerase subunit RPABC4/transcription elongation factor Spt4
MSSKKTCPFCKEIVKADAIICKHCKSELPPLPPKAAKKWYQTWRGFLLIMFVLSIFAGIFKEESPTKQPTPQEIAAKQEENDSLDARTYAKLYVEKALKAPTTAKWPSTLDFAAAPVKDKDGKPIKDVWEVSGYVDSQNSFGAMIRTEWYVKLRKIGDSWKLLELR